MRSAPTHARRHGLMAGLTVIVICLAVFPSHSAPSSGLYVFTKQLVRAGGVNLSGNINCEYGPGNGQIYKAYDGDDAAALLHVASQKRIFLYAHGFYTNARRPRPPLAYALDTFGGHLRIARNLREPYAACLFLSDTSAGFGDQQSTIGDFLFALRALTDDPELYDESREVSLIGYSAGVNYVKQAVVGYGRHLAANGLSAGGIKPTHMTAAFLGGVHNGTDTTNLIQAGVQLLIEIDRHSESKEKHSYQDWADARWREYLRSEKEALLNSRGAMQLRVGSAALSQLNMAFRKQLTPNVRVINFASPTDYVAPLTATQLPFVTTTILNGLDHWGFVANPLGGLSRKIAQLLYSDPWSPTR